MMIETILFAIIVGLVFIILLLLFSKSFNKILEDVVIKVEEELNGKSGQEKLKYAIEKIRKISWIAKLLSEKKLTELIDKLITEFNKFSK